jgi:hypothetical protein
MHGKDAKQQKYWADPQNTGRWAYFVPQLDLIWNDNERIKNDQNWLDD